MGGEKDEQVIEEGYPDTHPKSTCHEPKGHSRSGVKDCSELHGAGL